LRQLRRRGKEAKKRGIEAFRVEPLSEDAEMSMLDGYLVDPNLSLLNKTRVQAQVLIPVLRALRAEPGKEKADTVASGQFMSIRPRISDKRR
jgi:hypothetical protein